MTFSLQTRSLVRVNKARQLLGAALGPTTSGQLAIPGLTNAVLIRRDAHGVPHIDAASDRDAWFGLGFCQGQDRTFQLEILLRLARGTLSEIIGPDALPVDRLSRRIGFRHIAAASLPLLDDDVGAVVEGFAAGVTAGGTLGRKRRPLEFLLLRARPTPWEPADVAALLPLQSFLLASNWDQELARHQILRAHGAEALRRIDPGHADWLPVTDPPGTAAGDVADRLAADLAALRDRAGTGGGSNNWAVSPGRTATGRPILANDPHLAPQLPPHWYLCHVSTPAWSVAGAALTGSPAVAAGHNGFAAWGVTAGLIDNTDLYVEEVSSDGRRVRHGDGWAECEIRREVIPVRGAPPFVEDVLVTPRGPIVGPALDGEVGAVSMQGTWMTPARARGLLAVPRVRSFDEFRAAFRHWPALPLNLAYADENGTIGWQLAGQGPRRRRGHGLVPQHGADHESGWHDDPVPFDEMPHARDPETGWIATANNQPLPEGEGPFLGADWLDGYRVARIGEALAARRDWDREATMRLQLDQTSLVWREIRDAVLAAAPPSVHDLLAGWDGVVAAGSRAAAVYELFLAELGRALAETVAPDAAQWALGEGFTPVVPHTLFALRSAQLSQLVRHQPGGYFPEGWPTAISAALRAAAATAAGRTWGEVRPLTLRHPLGRRKPLDRIFDLGPFPWGGDANTVAQASPNPADPTDGTTVAIASLRMVVDVGAWENSRWVLPGGQSGNPLSPHYADQLPLWQRGDGIPIAWDEPQVAAATVHTLELRPR